MLSSSFVALVSLLGSAGVANAWFRVACTDPLVQERIDPIVAPGGVPSQHVHTVHGASNFGPNYTYALLRSSSCTSCLVAQASQIPHFLLTYVINSHDNQDLSNYWFPKLYFQDPKTKLFEPVSNGGLLVYYQNRGNGDKSNGGAGLKAFPEGFKMLTGNPTRRTKKFPVGQGSQGELAERAIQWSCLRYTAGLPGYDDNGTGFPTTDCESGLNARLHSIQSDHDIAPVPACWDGKNLDSPDHVSHTAYLSGLDNGACPSTHPVYLMKLFYEITWNVHDFTGRWNPSTDKWPFVYAPGDPTGFGWHGDFSNGWDTNALQNAIDKCNNPNDQTGNGVAEACSFLTVKSAASSNQCKINPVVKETIDGKLSALPGCNPLQYGPGDATLTNCAPK
ncbi:WSC domain protein [Favolaschia claudopus]|uniref:WSC domain protein n=1 Tax=Favolaschia claudopus TaxID=2862362 RepID=A0AAW0CS91_9AGAR